MPRYKHSLRTCFDRNGRLVCRPGQRELEADASYWKKPGVRLPAGAWEPEDRGRALRYVIQIPGQLLAHTFRSAQMYSGISSAMQKWHELHVRQAALHVLRREPSGMVEGPSGTFTLPTGNYGIRPGARP